MKSNNPFTRIENKFIILTEDELENSPFNTWKTCVYAFMKKYGDKINFASEKYGFEITSNSNGSYKIYQTLEG